MMYKVVWNLYSKEVGQKTFDSHEKAKLFFYMMVNTKNVSKAEIRKV